MNLNATDRRAYLAAFARVLLQQRVRANLSQGQLAAAAGIAQPTLGRYERATSTCDVYTFHAIARALELSASELAAGVDAEYARVRDREQPDVVASGS